MLKFPLALDYMFRMLINMLSFKHQLKFLFEIIAPTRLATACLVFFYLKVKRLVETLRRRKCQKVCPEFMIVL